MRVLIIEDDEAIAQTIETQLSAANLRCETAVDGEDGIQLATLGEYDVIVLDLSLPDITGHEVLARLRRRGVETPVLILTGRHRVEDKVASLDHGADDYLTKPFDMRELRARTTALARRSRGFASARLTVGTITVDLIAKTATLSDRILKLTLTEYRILELLCLRRGSIVSKDVILDHVYGGSEEPVAETLDVFLHNLRRKIQTAGGGDDSIRTVRGFGYLMEG